MRTELDAKLCEDFPKLFRDRYADPQTTAMCWGFECEDGWYDVIHDLCTKIQNYLDANPGVTQITATQVKEKYGTLRFYTDYGNEHIWKLIEEAEAASARTCEVCGGPGKLNSVGWLSTRCDEHR